MKNEYSFSKKWFLNQEKNFEIIKKFFENKNNLNFLEIGVYEGFSTIYIIENILNGENCKIYCIDPFDKFEGSNNMIYNNKFIKYSETYNIFLQNIKKYKDKVNILKGFSGEILRKLDIYFFDFIYIDGSHRACDVLEDLILSFRLLKNNGILMFDDYNWQFPIDIQEKELEAPKIAIDCFLKIFKKQYETIIENCCIRKII